jgi:hypothetical protein
VSTLPPRAARQYSKSPSFRGFIVGGVADLVRAAKDTSESVMPSRGTSVGIFADMRDQAQANHAEYADASGEFRTTVSDYFGMLARLSSVK